MKSTTATESTGVNGVNKVNNLTPKQQPRAPTGRDGPGFVDPVDVVDPICTGQQQVKPGPILCPTCGRSWLLVRQKCGLCGKTYREDKRPVLSDPGRGAGPRRLEADDNGN